MSTALGSFHFGGMVASANEIRTAFPKGGSEHLLMMPCPAIPGLNWPFPSTGIWSPPDSWDDLEYLFHAMARKGEWRNFETARKSDELRDICLVYHFHLESRRKAEQRSSYRWFAFRDPGRFGNVWFNLGGTYCSVDGLRPLWTSSEWMARLVRLYPWVAAKYRIRVNPGVPLPRHCPAAVRHIWKDEPECYPVVVVSGNIYLCAGGRALNLDLNHHTRVDRWGVYITAGGAYAQLMGDDPERILAQMKVASGRADRVDGLSPSGM